MHPVFLYTKSPNTQRRGNFPEKADERRLPGLGEIDGTTESTTMMHEVREYELSEELEKPSPAVSFLFSDFPLHRKEVEGMIKHIDTPIFAAGEAMSDPGVIHLFDSQEAFEHWARMTRFAQKFDEIHKIIGRARKGTDVSSASAIQLLSNVPIERQWPAAHSTADPTATVGATFYEGDDFTGRRFSTGAAAIADLSEIEFFKRAASIRVTGVCLLTSHVEFEGARLYLVGDPELRVAKLLDWGFDKNAASAIIV